MRVMVLVPPTLQTRNVARDLVYGCWCRGKRIAGIQFPPVSQLWIATVLRDSGHRADLVDATGMGIEELRREAAGYEAAVVLTSTMTVNEDASVLVSLQEANPRLRTIVCGAHPTFMPKATLSRRGIDFVVRGEAEYAIRDLVTALDRSEGEWREVPGIGYREKGQVLLNEPYPFIEDLDELPVPERSLLAPGIDYFNPVVKRLPFTTAFTMRGCPGKCTFCSSPSFYGRRIRARSARSVLDELREIRDQGYREVFFRDEIFTVSRARTRAICEGILADGIDLTWICSARVGSVDREMLALMKEAGCHMVRFGVESGSQEILDRIRKEITVGQIEETFAWTRGVGMDTHAHTMIGMPGESEETIKATIGLLLRLEPTIITCGICTPYPGTELFEQVRRACPEVGDGSECDLARLHTHAYYNHLFTPLSAESLERSIRRVYRSFYLRPSYLARMMRRMGSLDEFRRATLAAAQVFDFIVRGD